ncbi:hypothetical protein BKA62DRAFT_680290 [Auriculariales sp. MPI-PUGE-AT-0066]|nr:hypothetical protein BKA62DRAFT_680290 [Auriculariales sp. MPI-PUGE-AT-0066]
MSSDVGILQTRNNTLCYFPNADIATYAGNECYHPHLLRALLNHIDTFINPEANSIAYYDQALNHMGGASWVVQPDDTYIACFQGALFRTNARGAARFHSWCRFATHDAQFNYGDARNNGGVCSRVHSGGDRAERDQCISSQKASSFWISNILAFAVFVVICSFLRGVWRI